MNYASFSILGFRPQDLASSSMDTEVLAVTTDIPQKGSGPLNESDAPELICIRMRRT